MKFTSKAAIVVALLPVLSGGGSLLRAQGFVSNALSWLPGQTTALEYTDLNSLRSLPNYSSLRARYLGRKLQALEASLGQLGIHENDISEIMLAWQTANGKTLNGGVAGGQFDPAMIAQSATTANIKPQMVEGLATYCVSPDPQVACVAVVNNSTGVFGPISYVDAILSARAGKLPSIAQNQHLSQFVNMAQSDAADAPIWGVAVGPAVSRWIGGWMPGEKNLQMNWGSAFKNVQAILYNVEAGDDVKLSLKLECASGEAASSVMQLLQGLKLLQQMAWRSTNPNSSNPFQNMEVESRNSEVSLHLAADYTALSQMGPLGQP